MLILVVDDEPELTTMLERTLVREGFAVATFARAATALEYAIDHAPDLIISDVSMPEMDGFEFRRRYQERFPKRQTPFAFLSALGDPANVVQGLDSGAEDYLVKPVPTAVLVAKVRSLLRRATARRDARFLGELDRLPIPNVLQYCEQRGMTGSVEFSTARGSVTVAFEAGQLAIDDTTGDQLTELMAARDGTFVIHSRPIAFDAISEAAAKQEEAPLSKTSLPMGRLSGVQVGSRLLQLQTEYEPPPADQVVTVVILDGRVLKKRETKRPEDAQLEQIRALIDAQHLELERFVREKMSSAQGGQSASRSALPAAEPARTEGATEALAAEPREIADAVDESETGQDKSSLWKRGLELYRQGKLEACVVLLERAFALDPADTLLRANLETVRRRLSASPGGAAR